MDEKIMQCEVCGCGNCCERTDLKNEPVLCDVCYSNTKSIQADCSKCATICINKDRFEYEMLVKKYGCHRFTSKENT